MTSITFLLLHCKISSVNIFKGQQRQGQKSKRKTILIIKGFIFFVPFEKWIFYFFLNFFFQCFSLHSPLRIQLRHRAFGVAITNITFFTFTIYIRRRLMNSTPSNLARFIYCKRISLSRWWSFNIYFINVAGIKVSCTHEHEQERGSGWLAI